MSASGARNGRILVAGASSRASAFSLVEAVGEAESRHSDVSHSGLLKWDHYSTPLRKTMFRSLVSAPPQTAPLLDQTDSNRTTYT
jgi:hypothetical protein